MDLVGKGAGTSSVVVINFDISNAVSIRHMNTLNDFDSVHSSQTLWSLCTYTNTYPCDEQG
jgi:hypothetical protein